VAKKKLRILFNSNAPWAPSGYGVQMADLLPRIRDLGYPLGIICFHGLESGKIILDGVTCYPKIGDMWGADAMVNHAKDFKADVVISLQDIWTLDPNLLKQIPRWIPIVPIDHKPVPPGIAARLRLAYRIITYSQFGYNELKKIGLHSTYIQHTVDTSIVKPLEDKAKIRKELGIPEDIFLFGMISANKDNPPRKSFQQVLDAFKKFHAKHPKSGIYFHTKMKQKGGFPIEEYAKTLGVNKNIYTIQPYELMYLVDRKGLNKIMNMFDCLLCPSRNEGFGVPIIEAQAACVPPIVTDYTAMSELVTHGVTGYHTKVAYEHFTPLLAYVAVPSVASLYKNMEKMFKVDRKKMGELGREYVVKNYDVDKVFIQKWVPWLEMIEKEIYT